MGVIATDNFTRADASTLGSNWTNTDSSSWGISSNQAHCTATGGDSFAFTVWNANAFPNDQYSQITISSLAALTGLICPGVRMSLSAETSYFCQELSNTLYIVKMVAGSNTNLTSGSYTPAVGDVIYLSAVGTTLTAKVNGTTVLTTTDSSISSGSAGMGGLFIGNSTLVTPWTGGNFVSSVKHRLPLLGVGA
jgi:hypothetical protein